MLHEVVDEEEEQERKVGCWENWRALGTSPRDLWATYAVRFLDALAYFVFSQVLILYLVEREGYTVAGANVVYGVFGVCAGIFMVLLGGVADWLMVRRTMLVSTVIMAFAKVVLAFSGARWLSALMLYGPLAFSLGLSAPATNVAIKRYTTPRSSNFAFSVSYVLMNLGAALSGPCVDLVRIVQPPHVAGLGPYSLLIMCSALVEALRLLLIWGFIRDVEVDEHTGECERLERRPLSDWRAVARKGYQDFRTVLGDSNFGRLTLLSGCLIWVRSLFRYLDSLYSLYIPRLFGEEASHDVPYMSLLSINPIIVITLTVPMTALTRHFHPVTAITLGTMVSGFAPFFMVLGAHWWAVACFIIQLSLGEIIWSPVSYDYTARLALKGHEGMYFALSELPTFVAKAVNAMVGGLVFPHYCPSEHHCRPEPLWFIILGTTLLSPILLVALRRYVVAPLVINDAQLIELDEQHLSECDDDDE